jgi:hypothetical protein
MADAAGLHAQADFMRPRRRKIALLHLKTPARLWNHHCAHLRHRNFSFCD